MPIIDTMFKASDLGCSCYITQGHHLPFRTSGVSVILVRGQVTSDGGSGKKTAEMQMAGTFLDAIWDLVNETENGTEDIRLILECQDYPRLWWEALE